MSKKSRSKDNSKRPQPMVQQRAQAHQSSAGVPKAAAEKQQQKADVKSDAKSDAKSEPKKSSGGKQEK